jgi:hypothetical protein
MIQHITKIKGHALFITINLHLTINSASAYLGSGCCLRTLMYLRTGYRFYERTVWFSQEIKKKKKKHLFSYMSENWVKNQVSIWEPPNIALDFSLVPAPISSSFLVSFERFKTGWVPQLGLYNTSLYSSGKDAKPSKSFTHHQTMNPLLRNTPYAHSFTESSNFGEVGSSRWRAKGYKRP